MSEAFYSLPLRAQDRKYVRFWYSGQKYQFTALVMGLACSPRVFSKVLKTVFAVLRRNGHISTAYIDDSCLQGDTYIDCQHNIRETVQLMDSLGFTIHPSKSVLIPSKQNYICGILYCVQKQ